MIIYYLKNRLNNKEYYVFANTTKTMKTIITKHELASTTTPKLIRQILLKNIYNSHRQHFEHLLKRNIYGYYDLEEQVFMNDRQHKLDKLNLFFDKEEE